MTRSIFVLVIILTSSCLLEVTKSQPQNRFSDHGVEVVLTQDKVYQKTDVKESFNDERVANGQKDSEHEDEMTRAQKNIETERLRQKAIEEEKEQQRLLAIEQEKERQRLLAIEQEKERQRLLAREREEERRRQAERERTTTSRPTTTKRPFQFSMGFYGAEYLR